jgi:hypothetical protein
MFQLTPSEHDALRSQFVTLKLGRGKHRKYLPYAFTEQGVAMLSGVLRSQRAIHVNIEIMRAFVRLRQLLATHKTLARKLEELENQYDGQFKVVFEAIKLLNHPLRPIADASALAESRRSERSRNKKAASHCEAA